MKPFLMLLYLSCTVLAQVQEADLFPNSYDPSDISGIRILDVKEVSFKPIGDIKFTEISALAYDKREGLFALSDKGYLFRLELEIEDKKIKSLRLQEARVLKTKKGKPLGKKKSDAEGMSFTQEGLIISFERHPKVSLYSLKGRKIENYPLPGVLQKIKNYRKKNKALEAVTRHPEFGIITAPEVPLKEGDEAIHTLYSLHKRWGFEASGKITSIELMKDDNLLLLERDFNLLKGHTITLKKLNIMKCDRGVCPTKTLASLKSTKGWKLDNFEGMTRVKDDLYLMVSDDNGSFLQRCLFVLFELKL